MLSTGRAKVKKEKKSHNTFHMEKIMKRNNTKKEIIGKSLEPISWWMDIQNMEQKKISSQISSKKSRINP